MKRSCSLLLVLLAVGCARAPSPSSAYTETPDVAPRATTETIGPERWDTTDYIAEASTETIVAEASAGVSSELMEEYELDHAEPTRVVRDPIRPWNEVWFHFNNKVHLWVLRPVGIGWRYVVYPRPARIGIKNAIENLGFPGRFLNSLLQAKFGGAGREFMRFVSNSTIGVLGFWDPATRLFHIEPQEEDFGQTLGVWGLKNVMYITWPFVGPSSIRDTLGGLGDRVLNPIVTYWPVSLLNQINDISLDPDEYKNLLESAFNPYAAVRNAYIENRKKEIAE